MTTNDTPPGLDMKDMDGRVHPTASVSVDIPTEYLNEQQSEEGEESPVLPKKTSPYRAIPVYALWRYASIADILLVM